MDWIIEKQPEGKEVDSGEIKAKKLECYFCSLFRCRQRNLDLKRKKNKRGFMVFYPPIASKVFELEQR